MRLATIFLNLDGIKNIKLKQRMSNLTELKPEAHRILILVNVDWFFISHRLPIAIAAKSKGYEVHIACGFTKHYDYLKSLGFVLHPIKLQRSGTSLLEEYSLFRQIKKLIRNVKPDVLHLVTIKPSIYGGLASRNQKSAEGRPLKRVVAISGLGYIFTATGVFSSIRKLIISTVYRLALNRKNTKVIFQNPTDVETFVKQGIIKKEQSVLIRGSGVDLMQYAVVNEPEGTPVVAFVARLLISKGILEFVDAAKLAKTKGLNARYVLVGDFDDNPESITKEQLTEWIDKGIVEYWGYSSNIAATIAKTNIMVLPSYREGLPKSLIEAAACGRAVVTTDVPGCRDAIVPNQTGLLVPVRDSVALFEAIERLLKDEALRKLFAENGREWAESVFDINDVIQRHLDLYAE